MSKIKLIPVACERCGRKIYTTNKSIHGIDTLKEETEICCSDCVTADELADLNIKIGEKISRRKL